MGREIILPLFRREVLPLPDALLEAAAKILQHPIPVGGVRIPGFENADPVFQKNPGIFGLLMLGSSLERQREFQAFKREDLPHP